MSHITDKEIASNLEEIATLLELKGENPFKIRAYRKAIYLLETLDIPLGQFIEEANGGKIKGLGEALTEKITTMYETGSLPYLEKLRKEVPSSVLELLSIPGLGVKKVSSLWQKFNITNLEDLECACAEKRISAISGFGAKTETNILEGIRRIRKFSSSFLLNEANAIAKHIANKLSNSIHCSKLEIVGDLRRKSNTIQRIEIIALSDNPKELMNFFVNIPDVQNITEQEESMSSIVLNNGITIVLRTVPKTEFASAISHFTGNTEHNTALHSIAKENGYKLDEHGLCRNDKFVILNTEQDIYTALNLALIPPELRENQGEIEYASKLFKEQRNFERLVEPNDTKGVLHVHTTYSDGKNTLEEISMASKSMGYEYIGITDHSKSAAYAGGLKEDDIKRQHEEIDILNNKLAPFKIFKGIESDILPNGSLDYTDEVLETFDFVIASVHSKFNMSKEEMTKRINTAIKNPFTRILGHPTGRLLLKRDSYEVDMFSLLETASKHNTAIELNANPRRLDLDWHLHKRAKSLKIPIPICPDAHSIEGISNIIYGIDIARKGWLTKQDILTCWSVKDVEIFFAKR